LNFFFCKYLSLSNNSPFSTVLYELKFDSEISAVCAGRARYLMLNTMSKGGKYFPRKLAGGNKWYV
jgi:hypothetical protein